MASFGFGASHWALSSFAISPLFMNDLIYVKGMWWLILSLILAPKWIQSIRECLMGRPIKPVFECVDFHGGERVVRDNLVNTEGPPGEQHSHKDCWLWGWTFLVPLLISMILGFCTSKKMRTVTTNLWLFRGFSMVQNAKGLSILPRTD